MQRPTTLGVRTVLENERDGNKSKVRPAVFSERFIIRQRGLRSYSCMRDAERETGATDSVSYM